MASKAVPAAEQLSVENWLESNENDAVNTVGRWLLRHPSCAKTLLDRAIPQKSCESISDVMGSLNVDEEAEKLWKHFKIPNQPKRKPQELLKMDKHSLFMELLRDVVAPNFDVNTLSHKILVNVMLLVNADRSSLFLADEGQKMLVSRLFDVTIESSVKDAMHEESEAIKIPFGKGIAGHVAATGKAINIPDAYQDSRFNQQVDKYTGYKTTTILCMPILAPDGQAIGVAQVINKKDGGAFSKENEEDFRMFTTFCAIGLLNAQLLERTFYLSRRLKVLLDLAQGLFEETTSLDAMMSQVMKKAQQLIPCQHCTVIILDQEDTEKVVFTQAFQIESFNDEMTSLEIGSISDVDLVKKVATTGEPIMVNNAPMEAHLPVCSKNTTTDMQLLVNSDDKNVLCMPIFNKDHDTIGVVKMTNKLNGVPFDGSDEEVYAVFCGLSMHNVMNYERLLKANARQKVALEVLSFHASSPAEEADRVMQIQVPDSLFADLHTFEFDDYHLSEDQTVLASVRMFRDSGLTATFRIDDKVLYRWVLTVKKNYRPVTYHNWRHAFNVAQSMYTIFTSGQLGDKLTELEKLGLLIGCFCHDLDHRGTNNVFQNKMGNALAELYSTSTMEHHHFDHSLMILNSQGNEVLNSLTTAQHAEVMAILESAILSTDLALYFKKKGRFQELVKGSDIDWSSESHRDLLRSMLMTACDVAAITKPWEVQKRVAVMVASEFFEQGDKERQDLLEEPMAMMDRRKKNELPKMQVGFIDFICLPLYQPLADLHDGLLPLLNGVKDNRKQWQNLADNPEPEQLSFVTSDPQPSTSHPPINDDQGPPRSTLRRRCRIS